MLVFGSLSKVVATTEELKFPSLHIFHSCVLRTSHSFITPLLSPSNILSSHFIEGFPCHTPQHSFHSWKFFLSDLSYYFQMTKPLRVLCLTTLTTFYIPSLAKTFIKFPYAVSFLSPSILFKFPFIISFLSPIKLLKFPYVIFLSPFILS